MRLHPVHDNLWEALVEFGELGHGEFRILAWEDRFGSWRRWVVNWQRAGVDQSSELPLGLDLALSRLAEMPGVTAGDWLQRVRRAAAGPGAALMRLLLQPELAELLGATPDPDALESPALPVWVERQLAQVGAWYEFFPRSEGSAAGRSGTFATAATRLSGIAAMGFDVVYLPPIHPIGTTARRGPNNTVPARPGDPGSPWAIGSPAGGHTAVNPELGTLEDFDRFRAEAERLGMEVALDYTLQCSPDHPWVSQHPEWFVHRPDGSIRTAENPPKRYDDVYPLDFLCADWRGLWLACYQVLEFWIQRGVRVFRVDNPHTKPLPFWRWVWERLRSEHPEVVMLAEAFTTPALMFELSKLGFSQSYTYFTWRNRKAALETYLEQLASETPDFYRPNFFANTPDILTRELAEGGPAAFRARFVLAATLSPSYGIYSGFELFENVPLRRSSEEYLDSEKYQFRPRDWDRAPSMTPLIAQVNRLRHTHPALQQLRGLRFHRTGSPWVISYSRRSADGHDTLLIAVNLDPARSHSTFLRLHLDDLGLRARREFGVRELLSGQRAVWKGSAQRIELDPKSGPALIWAIEP